jgi:hypothetical protein
VVVLEMVEVVERVIPHQLLLHRETTVEAVRVVAVVAEQVVLVQQNLVPTVVQVAQPQQIIIKLVPTKVTQVVVVAVVMLALVVQMRQVEQTQAMAELEHQTKMVLLLQQILVVVAVVAVATNLVLSERVETAVAVL